jgi:hypothetical protein
MNEPVSMPHGLATHLLVVTGHVYRRRHREGNMKRLGLIVVTTAFALLAGCASSAPNAAASHHMVSCYEEDAATGTVWEITSPSPCGSLARLLIPDAKFQLLNYNPTMTVVCTSYYSSDGITDRAGYTGTPDDATQTLLNSICGLFEHGGGSVTRNGSVPVPAAVPTQTHTETFADEGLPAKANPEYADGQYIGPQTPSAVDYLAGQQLAIGSDLTSDAQVDAQCLSAASASGSGEQSYYLGCIQSNASAVSPPNPCNVDNWAEDVQQLISDATSLANTGPAGNPEWSGYLEPVTTDQKALPKSPPLQADANIYALLSNTPTTLAQAKAIASEGQQVLTANGCTDGL